MSWPSGQQRHPHHVSRPPPLSTTPPPPSIFFAPDLSSIFSLIPPPLSSAPLQYSDPFLHFLRVFFLPTPPFKSHVDNSPYGGVASRTGSLRPSNQSEARDHRTHQSTKEMIRRPDQGEGSTITSTSTLGDDLASMTGAWVLDVSRCVWVDGSRLLLLVSHLVGSHPTPFVVDLTCGK